MTTVAFLGPSLPVADARAVLDAIYLPPARQSDIVSAIGTYRPDVIALIDGEFGQSLSVWHKEILFALSEGIAVFGASSMGALRAAETAAYGMVGVGDVYRMFASGELNDDDEVALAHGLAEANYRNISEPMVNLRATFQRARDEGAIDAATCDRLVAIAKGLFFPERSFSRIFHEAAGAGVPEEVLARLGEYRSSRYVDLKRQDALALLATIRDLPADRQAPPAFTFNRTALFDTLYNRDRKVRHGGVDVPLAAIANFAALNLPNFNELNVHALNRGVVVALAEMLDVTATEDDVAAEARRFRVARGLAGEDAFQEWLTRTDLDEREFNELMGELAVCRSMHQWLMTGKFMERSVKFVLNELRLRNEYEPVAAKAATQERILEEQYPHFKETNYRDLSTRDLVVDQMRARGARIDTHYRVWAQEAGFHSTADLRVELIRARLARDYGASLTESVVGAQE